MEKTSVNQLIEEFCQQTHGSSSYDKDSYFVLGSAKDKFAPLSFLKKKDPSIVSTAELIKEGFSLEKLDLIDNQSFHKWFERQFSKKLTSKNADNITLVKQINLRPVFDSLETIDRCYEVLRSEDILLNSKNLPVQIGEWFAKCIFGLQQIKSSSQRGFDFRFGDKKVEVKVHWSEKTSHKGVRIKKSLARLSDWCIIIYLNRNFMIRDICLLDSEFILRKFSGKGHTVFLKDPDVSSYFFSHSSKHFDKILNKKMLMQFSSPNFAMKLDEKFRALG